MGLYRGIEYMGLYRAFNTLYRAFNIWDYIGHSIYYIGAFNIWDYIGALNIWDYIGHSIYYIGVFNIWDYIGHSILLQQKKT